MPTPRLKDEGRILLKYDEHWAPKTACFDYVDEKDKTRFGPGLGWAYGVAVDKIVDLRPGDLVLVTAKVVHRVNRHGR
jgi:hypothetical protein